MSESLKYCLAICLFLAVFVVPNLGAQQSYNELDEKIYAFDLAVIKNKHEDIESLGKEIANYSTKVEDPNYQVQILIVQSKLSIRLGEMEKAQLYIDKADLIYKSEYDLIQIEIASSLFYTKSLYARFSGELVLEENYLDSCLMILNNGRNFDVPNVGVYSHEAANIYQKLCYLYYGKGQVMKSIDFMQMAKVEMEQIDKMNLLDSLQIGNIYNDIAYLSGSMGNNDEVIPYYRLALQYNPTSHSILLSLANNLRYEGDHKTANLLVRKLLDETEDHRLDIKAMAMVTMIAIIGTSEQYLYENPEEEMINCFNKVKEYQESLTVNNYPADATAAGTMCDYFRRVSKKRNYDRAAEYLEEQGYLLEKRRSLLQNENLFSLETNYLSRKAQITWVGKDYETAEKYIKEIIELFTGDKNASDEQILSMILKKEDLKTFIVDYARMLANQGGNLDDGIRFLDKAENQYDIVDTAVDSLLSFNESKIEADVVEELQKVGFGIALKQYEATGDKNYLQIAYQRFEKLSTMTSYRHHALSTIQYRNKEDSDLKKQKNRLREEMDILEGVVSEGIEEQTRTKKSLDSLTNIFLDISENLDSAKNSYEYQIEKNKLASLDQLQQSMSEDELYYHVALDRITEEVYILLVSKNELKSKIFVINDLRFKIDQILESLSNPETTDYQVLLKELNADFIAPFESLMKNKKLVFIPCQYLSLLPFGLLMDREGDYLCLKNPVLYKYSSSWQAKENKDRQKANKFMAYAVPLSNSESDNLTEEGIGFLSAALEEVNLLKEKYGADLFYDKNNPKVSFIEHSAEAKLLHVAVHSKVEPLNPIKSSLLLSAEDEEAAQLYYHEIDDLDLSADLVLLSSCQSGITYHKNGGSVTSLARAFQLAGAKNLIQTAWSINDESTSKLMEEFYNKIDEGNEISVSLAEAKREFIKNAPSKWQHPYYWGSFVLNGEDGFIEIPKKSFLKSSSPGLFGIFAILLIFVFSRSKSKITSS